MVTIARMRPHSILQSLNNVLTRFCYPELAGRGVIGLKNVVGPRTVLRCPDTRFLVADDQTSGQRRTWKLYTVTVVQIRKYRFL